MISNNELLKKTNVKKRNSTELILAALQKINFGQIVIKLPSDETFSFMGSKPGPQAQMQIYDETTFDMCIERSDIGFGEAYMQGLWQTTDISKLIEFMVVNKSSLEVAMYGLWYKIFIYKVKHMFNANSKSGSRKNIQAHYDLGNEFYKLWLDSTMTYSSAYWGPNQNLSLAEAQKNKYKLILNQLNAKSGARILEIGCGWGGFAEYAALQGMHVTGVTISNEQYSFALERIKNAGLNKKVEIKLMDYRDLEGSFDYVVSIEMLEAVGQAYWGGYFKKIKEVLRPGGKVCIQTITIIDEAFDQYSRGTDFIQQYIFPGGMLPCERELKKNIFKIRATEPDIVRFGLDYARTLRFWAESFKQQKDKITTLKYSVNFQKMWDFYLGYCEGAFRGGQIDVILLSYTVK